jgi:ubiquinone/menaquinone biosynthesis C-methylase UbiE
LESAALNAQDRDLNKMDTMEVKQQVRQFYDQVGWQLVGEQQYQNAHYEDLRPVASEYVHRCHLRVARHLNPTGRLLLDAGSGPIQYPEYLLYSAGYARRVCADISIVALQEARKRIGDHGLFVVADVANLPFKPGVFDGVVSLHTIHHLPEGQHIQAYRELYRTLGEDRVAVVVNGSPNSRLVKSFDPLIAFSNRLRGLYRRLFKRQPQTQKARTKNNGKKGAKKVSGSGKNSKTGTFTQRHDASWLETELGAFIPVEIRVWRSVNVRFTRALIHSWLGGRWLLRGLYVLEEKFPHFFGTYGSYPLILIRKRVGGAEVKR